MSPINLQATIHLLQALISRQQLEGKDAALLAGKNVCEGQRISWYSLTILTVNRQVLRQRLINQGMMTNGSDTSELNIRLITADWLRRPTKVLGGNEWVVGVRAGGETVSISCHPETNCSHRACGSPTDVSSVISSGQETD